MPNFLKGKTAGLPRWAWLLILTGAVLLGLYMRKRREQQMSSGAAVPSPDNTYGAGDASLVGASGPVGGGVVPVQTPTLPEGFPESFQALAGTLGGVFAGQGETIQQLAGYLQPAQGSTAGDSAPAQTTPTTGGGAPSRPSTAHSPTKRSAVGGLPSDAGKTWESQIRWLSTHPVWYKSHPVWVSGHPETVSAAKALPGNHLPG